MFMDMDDMGFGAHMPQSAGSPPKRRAQELEYDLNCTLEELYTGRTKKMRITRTVEDANTGAARQEAQELQIDVRPGWKAGTKVRFNGAGDIRQGSAPQDVVFIVREKPHPAFTRAGDDLATTVKLPLKDALLGNTLVTIPTIDGKGTAVQLRGVTAPATRRTLAGYGMPKKGGGFGNLVVTFDVEFPASLTPQQQATLATVL
jgi:DnaJ-class molecular chaperone